MAKTKKYGEWQILGPLREGGQAWTHHVRHKDGREGVLKVIKNPKRKWRSDREIIALKSLKSSAIPIILDSGESEKYPWIVTEYCGQPLQDVIKQATVVHRLSWFRDIVQATKDAHQAGIIHRDIKPDSVVISTDERAAYLIDFGICAISEAVPSLTTLEAFGNPVFAAPECALGHSEQPGKPSDIYSLGKVLYWLTSGGKPIFREEISALEGTLLPISANIEARILSVIRACVKESSQLRPTSEELLIRAQNLLVYADKIIQEENQGLFRIIDNLGNNGEFNVSSSRSVVSPSFVMEDLHPSCGVFGLKDNRSLAIWLKNKTNCILRTYRILLGIGCSSPVGRIYLSLAEDSEGRPSGRELKVHTLDLINGPPKIYSFECDIKIAPGPFWILLRPADLPKTYVSIHVATDDVAPCRSIFAESDNGGEIWNTMESPSGPGLAVRIDAKAK